MNKAIVDIRVGCVAVYPGPVLNCLSGINDRGSTYYYRHGTSGDDYMWTVKKRHVWVAKIIASLINWGDK